MFVSCFGRETVKTNALKCDEVFILQTELPERELAYCICNSHLWMSVNYDNNYYKDCDFFRHSQHRKPLFILPEWALIFSSLQAALSNIWENISGFTWQQWPENWTLRNLLSPKYSLSVRPCLARRSRRRQKHKVNYTPSHRYLPK